MYGSHGSFGSGNVRNGLAWSCMLRLVTAVEVRHVRLRNGVERTVLVLHGSRVLVMRVALSCVVVSRGSHGVLGRCVMGLGIVGFG